MNYIIIMRSFVSHTRSHNVDGWNFIAVGGGDNYIYSRVWNLYSCYPALGILSDIGAFWTGSLDVYLGCKSCTISPLYIIHSFKVSEGADLALYSWDLLLTPINRK